jgi:hypothetical protein
MVINSFGVAPCGQVKCDQQPVPGDGLLDQGRAGGYGHAGFPLDGRYPAGMGDAGHLRPGITISEAADILWTYSSPELYDLLARQRGWPAERYGKFVGQAVIAALLAPEAT